MSCSRGRRRFECLLLPLFRVRPCPSLASAHCFGPGNGCRCRSKLPERLTRVACLVAILLFVPFVWGQRKPVGALEGRGEVYVNGVRVEGQTTVFAGDTVRTGSDGAAGITVAGRGMLILAAQTELSLAAQPRFLAELQRGTVGQRSLENAQGFQVRVGPFVVLPATESASAAELQRAIDGSARISCTAGSVFVLALEGDDFVFLRPGQSASISAQGLLSVAEGTPPRPAQAPPPTTIKKTHKGAIILGVAGAGAAGAALALARSKKEPQPVSPSQP